MVHVSKIIFVSHEFRPKLGGIATYIEETLSALVKREDVVVEAWYSGPGAPSSVRENYAVKRISSCGNLGFYSLFSTANFLVRHSKSIQEATLCLAEPGPIIAYLLPFSKRLPKPKRLVLVLHGSEILRIASNRYYRAGFSALLKSAHVIGVVSKFTKGLLEKYFPGNLERVVLVSGALRSDLKFGSEVCVSHAECGELRLLSLARMHRRKGFHHVIQALGRLPESLRSKVRYSIAYPSDNVRYKKELQNMAVRNGVRLELELDPDCLNSVYESADIFVMTSDTLPRSVEGFGLVYLEAGAAGLPVVAFDSGGVGEAVWDGRTGLLVQPGDICGLAEALKQLITNQALRKRLGQAGRERVKQLSWESNLDRLFPVELSKA